MKRICYLISFLMILGVTGCGSIVKNGPVSLSPISLSPISLNKIFTLFEHTTIPLDINCSETQRGLANSAEGNIKHLHFHYNNVDIDFLWDSNAIGDIAKRNKLEKIYFADMEILSILGIWKQYTVHVYGE